MGAIRVLELGFMQQLVQPRDLLVTQLPRMHLHICSTAHLINQAPCSSRCSASTHSCEPQAACNQRAEASIGKLQHVQGSGGQKASCALALCCCLQSEAVKCFAAERQPTTHSFLGSDLHTPWRYRRTPCTESSAGWRWLCSPPVASPAPDPLRLGDASPPDQGKARREKPYYYLFICLLINQTDNHELACLPNHGSAQLDSSWGCRLGLEAGDGVW